MAERGTCSKSGYVEMYDLVHRHVVPTMCKTWGCNPCAKARMRYVQGVLYYGMVDLVNSWFTTVTYVMKGPDDLRNAECVARDSRLLVQRLKRLGWPLVWFKVPELTKQGQVHLHYVMGGFPETMKDTCNREPRNMWKWLQNGCSYGCLRHTIAREWYAITGDSYVVHVEKIL